MSFCGNFHHTGIRRFVKGTQNYMYFSIGQIFPKKLLGLFDEPRPAFCRRPAPSACLEGLRRKDYSTGISS
jgi:hypothetical protein